MAGRLTRFPDLLFCTESGTRSISFANPRSFHCILIRYLFGICQSLTLGIGDFMTSRNKMAHRHQYRVTIKQGIMFGGVMRLVEAEMLP